MSLDVSNERLKAALRTAAELVDVHGDEYLPVFERLEAEWIVRQKNTNTKDRIKALLREHHTTA